MAGRTEVGKLALVLTAESSQFDKAVDKAQVKLYDLSKSGSKGFSLGGMGDALKGAWADPIGALGSAMPYAAPMAAAASLGAMVLSVGDDFHATTKRAEELGISTAALTGLHIAAKDRADEMEVALQHLERTIGEAAGGSKEAQAKFTALGVSWQELEAMSPEAAFGRVNDQIKESGNAYMKAAAAREFYGRAGQQNMRLIEKGSAGIDAGIATAKEKGLVPDAKFTKQYEQYLATKRDVFQTLAGFKNAIAVNIGAPLLETFTTLDKAFSEMMKGPDYTGTLAQRQASEAALQKTAEARKATQNAIAQAYEREVKAASESLVSAREMSDQLERQAAAHGAIGAEMKLHEAMRKEREAREAAKKDRGSHDRGAGELWSPLFRGAIKDAATDKWHEAAQEWRQVLKAEDEARRNKALDTSAASLIGEIESPLEKYQSRMGQIAGLWNTGRLSAEQTARAMLLTTESIEKAAAAQPFGFLLQGSQADRSFGMNLDREAARSKQSFDERRKAVEGQLLTTGQQLTGAIKELSRQIQERKDFTEEMGGLDTQ